MEKKRKKERKKESTCEPFYGAEKKKGRAGPHACFQITGEKGSATVRHRQADAARHTVHQFQLMVSAEHLLGPWEPSVPTSVLFFKYRQSLTPDKM